VKKINPLYATMAGLACLAAVSFGAAGCAEATKQSSPDPTSDQIQMVAPLQIIGMPQGFRNIAVVCDKFGNLLYVTSRGSDFAGGPNGGGLGSGMAVVPNAPVCKR
jgi:hypothetical protein